MPYRPLPGAELPRRPLEDEQPQFYYQSGLFGDIDEFGRRHSSELWMVPARQRFKSCNRTIVEPHDRLVHNGNLFALDGAAEIGLDGEPVGLARAHRGLEDFDP